MKSTKKLQNDPKTPQKRPRKGELTRLRILNGVIFEIAKSGFEGLVLTDVAKFAGVTRANLLQHFESRENLIEESTHFLGAQGREFTLNYLTTHAGSDNRILLYIRATFAWARERREQAIFLVYLLNRAGYDKRSNGHVQSIFQVARHRLAMDILDCSQKSKKSKIDPKQADELALQIHSNLLGYIVQLAPMYHQNDLIEFERQCMDITKIILKSYLLI